MADELIQINKGIKRLVKLIETSTIVDKTAVSELRRSREFAARERDEKGKFVKKEEDIQEKKKGMVEKQTDFLKSQKGDFKKKLSADWELWKNNSKIVALHRAFWKSEAGNAIKNVFGRVKTIFNNILGEIGEFFDNLWGTVKDTFQFFKGTIGSIVNVLRGGTRKNKRDKEQAKDIKKMRKSMTRAERKSLLKKGKKEKTGGLFTLLGLKALFGITSIAALLPLLLPSLGIGLLIASFGLMLFKGIKSFMDKDSAAKIITESIKGFFKASLFVIKWLMKLFDLVFGTDIAKYFEQEKFDKMLDKHLLPFLDKLFDTIFEAALDIINFTKDALSGRLKAKIIEKIDEKIKSIPFLGDVYEKTKKKPFSELTETERARKQLEMSQSEEKLKGWRRFFGGAGQDFTKRQLERDKREMEALDLQKKTYQVNKEMKEILFPPQEPMAPVLPPPNNVEIKGPDHNSQKYGGIGLQNNN